MANVRINIISSVSAAGLIKKIKKLLLVGKEEKKWCKPDDWPARMKH